MAVAVILETLVGVDKMGMDDDGGGGDDVQQYCNYPGDFLHEIWDERLIGEQLMRLRLIGLCAI